MSLIGRLTSTEPRAVAHGPAVKLTVTVGLTSLTADILHHLVIWVESHLVISVAVKKIGVLFVSRHCDTGGIISHFVWQCALQKTLQAALQRVLQKRCRLSPTADWFPEDVSRHFQMVWERIRCQNQNPMRPNVIIPGTLLCPGYRPVSMLRVSVSCGNSRVSRVIYGLRMHIACVSLIRAYPSRIRSCLCT